MAELDVTLRPLADSGFLLELKEEISPEISRQCVRLRAAIEEAWRSEGPGRLLDVVPAYRSLAVYFDPDRTDPAEAADFLRRVLAARASPAPQARQSEGTRWRVPVVYGGAEGPDLATVAQGMGLSEVEVVRQHVGTLYRLYMHGFAPGHASMAENPPALRIGRRTEPRAAVEQGAVGIGGRQCGIYSLKGPGGLHIIGRTAVRLFFPEQVPPTPIAVGDEVVFHAVERLEEATRLERVDR